MWPRGVTVTTLDSESSDRGSNPRGALTLYGGYEYDLWNPSGCGLAPPHLRILGLRTMGI